MQIAPVAAQALQALADRLMRVCENPQQPGFNHFLFESVAALIRFGSEADPAMVVRFEGSLFPAFEKVLQARLAAPLRPPNGATHADFRSNLAGSNVRQAGFPDSVTSAAHQ